MEERKLVRRLQKRSRGALEQAIGQYTAYVSVTVWRAMGAAATREDVEEVVSDVFLALWAHAAELDESRDLLPWLGAVARNRAVDRLRQVRPTLPLPEEAPAAGDGPEERSVVRDRAERLWQAVETLGEPDRTLFLRHYYYGDKLKDAAHGLGLSSGAAKTRLSRGRKRLKELLTEGGDGL